MFGILTDNTLVCKQVTNSGHVIRECNQWNIPLHLQISTYSSYTKTRQLEIHKLFVFKELNGYVLCLHLSRTHYSKVLMVGILFVSEGWSETSQAGVALLKVHMFDQ